MSVMYASASAKTLGLSQSGGAPSLIRSTCVEAGPYSFNSGRTSRTNSQFSSKVAGS
jgi:hypothetical protein